MQMVEKRIENFIKYNNLNPDDPLVIEKFIDYLSLQADPREALPEEEAFKIYNCYRVCRKEKIPEGELAHIVDRTWYHEYNKRGFKKLTSNKSLNFINQIRFFKRNNLFILCWGYLDNFGVGTRFIGLEKVHTSLGTVYFFRSSHCAPNEDMFFTQHFFDRYEERNNLNATNENSIRHFLREEFTKRVGLCLTDSKGQASLPTRNGLCLGNCIKNMTIFKTFVHGDNLGNNQILDALRHYLFTRDRLKYLDMAEDFTFNVVQR